MARKSKRGKKKPVSSRPPSAAVPAPPAAEQETPGRKTEPDWRRLVGWLLLVVGVPWLIYVFVKYFPGRAYFPLYEALVDCTPLILITAGIVLLYRAAAR